MKLELYFPAKPYWITQAWGIKNPSYEQFGFSEHNGQDFMLGADKHVYVPVKAEIVEQGYNNGAGNFLRFVTTEKYEVGDKTCYVGFMIMHYKETYLKVGDICEVGTDTGIANNTGFSTGPHTHISWYRLKAKQNKPSNRLDINVATDRTFDPQPYWNGKFAQDVHYTFTHDLYTGVKDKEVKELQKFLNTNGFVVAESGAGSRGKETDYFGSLTQNALIKFQKANNITPAAGYFGSKTRGVVNKSG